MSKAAIVEFFLKRFSSDELRRLMSYNYPDVTRELPGATATPAQVADTCAEVLLRKEHIDAKFFALLRQERNKVVVEIDALERAHQAELRTAPPAASSAPQTTAPAKKAAKKKAAKKIAKETPVKRPAPTEKSAYRWLHLTDIHYGSRGRAAWVQVVDDFGRSLDEWLPRLGGPIDLVLVTGDLTNRGSLAEFDGVSAFFDRVLQRITRQQGTEPLLVAVPGNHDLVRPADVLAFAAYDRYVEIGDQMGLLLHERLWTAKNPDRVVDLFAEYTRWMETYMLPKLAKRSEVQVHRSFFPGDLSVTIELPGRFPLGLVGLNSAWLQYQGGDFEGKLALPAEQFQAALPCPPGGAALDYFEGPIRQALLMHHHPPAWLSQAQQTLYGRALYVPHRFAACLFGHMHTGGAQRQAAGGGNDRVYFQTPSLFGLEGYGEKREHRLFGYTFGRLREDGELLAWPLVCVVNANQEHRFVRDMNFHWRDDQHVVLRQGL